MNDIESAIRGLNALLNRAKDMKLDWFVSLYEAAIKALEKQMPKKPITMDADGYSFVRYECPACNKYIIGNFNPHCAYCGQSLNWSKSEAKEDE